MRSSRWVVVVLFSLACSGKTAAGSASALDGTWKVTMLPSDLLGATLKDGTIVVSGGTATATFDYPDVGTKSGPCTVATHQSVTQVLIQGSLATTTTTETVTYSGCSQAPQVGQPQVLTFQQTSPKPSTFTPYDGVWTVSASGQGNIAELTITNNQWSFAATAPSQVLATGSVVNGVATATDMQSDFAAQRQ
jgi:hypothetical protein